jgi:hypothetical protein
MELFIVKEPVSPSVVTFTQNPCIGAMYCVNGVPELFVATLPVELNVSKISYVVLTAVRTYIVVPIFDVPAALHTAFQSK